MERGPEEGSLSHLGQGSTFGSQVLASAGCGEFPPRDHLLCRPDVPAETRPFGGNSLEKPGCGGSHSPSAPRIAFLSRDLVSWAGATESLDFKMPVQVALVCALSCQLQVSCRCFMGDCEGSGGRPWRA